MLQRLAGRHLNSAPDAREPASSGIVDPLLRQTVMTIISVMEGRRRRADRGKRENGRRHSISANRSARAVVDVGGLREMRRIGGAMGAPAFVAVRGLSGPAKTPCDSRLNMEWQFFFSLQGLSYPTYQSTSRPRHNPNISHLPPSTPSAAVPQCRPAWASP